ncbi:helix-turn-helix domain-containing protein [Synechococcales cyanobacterium C]|uniref:Helix-turn-helix domain-containing protein n=1 Tax=Petrachloros mirabilis ULC683 TaxID=2781853 RepID=A0A8K2A2L2_9CYAN|nr:AraC family transcriptional regulator [Petrachloros mirabilis]NCJ08422.1 helix-turn-helix domain-containing protein [Petrachloros mirabilis ULC683]
MVVSLSQQAYWQLFEEKKPLEQPDQEAVRFDIGWCCPTHLGCGYIHSLDLRPGLTLDIADYTLFDEVVITSTDRLHPIEYTFNLATTGSPQAERYGIWGSGLAPGETYCLPAHQRLASVSVHLEPTGFCDWLGLSEDELPSSLRSLIRPADQHYYEYRGTPLASMQMVLQQIWNCPYQGLTQRLYLESKVWELMTLILDGVGSDVAPLSSAPPLKAHDIECIRYASQILQTRLDQPPSLLELARLVGINDHKLKLGFHQVFGSTVFGHLHELRLERSRQLLESGDMSVTAASHAVGFANRGHFAAAFRRRYGVNPGVYVRQRRA